MNNTPGDRQIHLLPRQALRKTGDIDQADWNYRPLLGAVSRLRFKLIRDLLGPRRHGRLLEVGYGSGVFMPELSRRCGTLYGIDVHADHLAVTEILRSHGVDAKLLQASVSALPFEDSSFDAVVAVSALEFVDDLDAACRELRRVLRPGGILVAVTPGDSALLDLGLKVLTGRSAKKDFGKRRQGILAGLGRHFRPDEQRESPALLTLYTAGRFIRES